MAVKLHACLGVSECGASAPNLPRTCSPGVRAAAAMEVTEVAPPEPVWHPLCKRIEHLTSCERARMHHAQLISLLINFLQNKRAVHTGWSWSLCF